MKNDFKITLHQTGTDAVTVMAVRHFDATQAMAKARRCCGKDWFVVTLEEAA